MSKICKIFVFSLLFIISVITSVFSANHENDFDNWLSSYKKFALEKGISQETINITFKNAKFLEEVIKYDRKQPEFFDDTLTYVSKRANKSRVKMAKKLFKKNKKLFNGV